VTDLLARLGVPGPWIETLHLDLLLRLLLASVLGGIIGLEREISGKPAGLRTNLLICVGAALLMELSLSVAGAANLENAALGVPFRADPARIAAQIVSGIGFLGAGTILQSRGNITGLTTAATIWVVAAIGMAVGTRAYVEAVGSAVLVVGSLVVLGRLERALLRQHSSRRYLLTLEADPELVGRIRECFRDQGLQVETESVEIGERFELALEVTGPMRRHDVALARLTGVPGVHRISRGG
jgi:putative Mg2+ transporter-C (MgtC) family protein